MAGINKKSGQDVIASMFITAAAALIFTQVAGVVATIIDGVVTSRFLGTDAYSAISLLVPLTNIILLMASFISIGGQILCAQKIGAGEREEAAAIFTFSSLFGIVVALLFVAACLLAPGTLFRICGVSLKERPELYTYMLRYLRGYLPGIPAVIMVQVLSPFLVIDNGKKLVSLSAFVLCAADIVGDLVNALLVHGGVFGMGLATTIALWLQLLILISHFIRKSSYFLFTMKSFRFSHLTEIVKGGSLAFVRKLATIMRDIIVNRINLAVAVSTAAIAAKGVQNDLNQLMFCLGLGIGKALLSITAMYYGAKDRNGLKRLFACAMKTSVILAGICGAVLFLAAPFIARIYTNNPEVISLAVFSIRCMAAGLILDTVAVAYQDYLQGIHSIKMVNFLCFSERLFIPVLVALVLGRSFGSKGIMASIAVGKLVLIIMMFVILVLRNKGIPKKWEDCMLLPEGFGGGSGENAYAQIRTMDDVIRESEHAQAFCLEHGADKRTALLVSLFVEEMSGNIVTHGNPRTRGGVCVDYRLFVEQGNISLSIRDYCEQFDPVQFYEIHRADSPESKFGIRMVMKLAKDIRYINAFNSNSLLINLDYETAEKRSGS